MQTVHELRPIHDPEKVTHRSFTEYAELATKAGLAVLGDGKSKGFSGSVHNPELMAHQLANATMVQLFDASAIAPGDLRDKILAFQGEVRTFLVRAIKEAMRSEQLRIGLMLEAAGHSSAAALTRTPI
jgi:hypothetical protein